MIDLTSQDLLLAVQAVCPAIAVTIGDQTDRTTWQVALAASATPDQIIAAKAVIASFTPNPVASVPGSAAILGKLLDGHGSARN